MQEVEIKKEKNTDEKAVIIIKVPQIEEEEEIKVEVSGSEGQKTEIIKKMVDEDQKDSAIVIQGRDVQGIRIQEAKQFYNINQYAGKAYREDFMNFIAKQFPEFFDDNDDFDKIMAEAHRLADKDIAMFAQAWTIEILMYFYRVWHVAPFAFVIFYAGLQTVNMDTLESAVIDGASRWERLRHVIVPHLMPLIIFIALIASGEIKMEAEHRDRDN